MNEDLKNRIWDKASIVKGVDPNFIRKDCCGAWIIKSEFGNVNSKFGWEIDHVYPQSKGGDDQILNLRPMQWENNRAKGDDFPVYNIAVCAEGNENVNHEKQFKINASLLEKLGDLYKLDI